MKEKIQISIKTANILNNKNSFKIIQSHLKTNIKTLESSLNQ